MGEQVRDSQWSLRAIRKVLMVFHGCKSEYWIHIDYNAQMLRKEMTKPVSWMPVMMTYRIPTYVTT
jgi:hypothetical protein